MTTQSFSGSDFSVVIVFDQITLASVTPARPFKHVSEMQTITISSTTSINPVRRLGEKKPACFTRGARTFAGTMVFTVVDKDPFQELFAMDALSNSVKADGSWHIDTLPPFDIVLSGVNEGGTSGVQLISNVYLTNWGTTYSVDDMYTESTYTYVAEHVSPFIANPVYDKFLKAVKASYKPGKSPDDALNEVWKQLGANFADYGYTKENLTSDFAQEFDNFVSDFILTQQPGQVYTQSFLNDPVLIEAWAQVKYNAVSKPNPGFWQKVGELGKTAYDYF